MEMIQDHNDEDTDGLDDIGELNLDKSVRLRKKIEGSS